MVAERLLSDPEVRTEYNRLGPEYQEARMKLYRDMSREELEAKVVELRPWHYCWQLPHGVVTGTSEPNLFPEKMKCMIDGGGFGAARYPRVLDLGANSGYISKWFADIKGSMVTAVEDAEHYFGQLEFIIGIYGYQDRITPVKADILTFMPVGEYDLVLLLGTYHHLPVRKRPAVLRMMFNACAEMGGVMVQTERDLDVSDALFRAGFSNIVQVYDSLEQDRAAWSAVKPVRATVRKSRKRS
jgi:hypothetical protein